MTRKDLFKKIERYCSYQDRCQTEVIQKLKFQNMEQDEIDEIIVHLINHNFLNEERFAKSFARGKHRIKYWGKNRIINELKFKNISQTNINTALKEITDEEYLESFNFISNRSWESIMEKNPFKKKKKFCDFLLRKGYDYNMVLEKIKELENQ